MLQVLTRIRAVTLGSGWAFKVHFEVVSGNDEHYFDFQQGKKLGECKFQRHNLKRSSVCNKVVRDFLSQTYYDLSPRSPPVTTKNIMRNIQWKTK
jgi:hypothetical protein